MFPMYQTPFSITASELHPVLRLLPTFLKVQRIGFGPAGSTSDTYFPRMMEELGVKFERRNGGLVRPWQSACRMVCSM
jgi:ribosomal protein L17